MTTITIDEKTITSKYSNEEIKLKFIDFLRRDLKEDNINIYQVEVDDLPQDVKEAYDNIEKMNFNICY